LGVRTDEQKRGTAALEKVKYEKRRLPAAIYGDFSRVPATVSAIAVRGGEKYTGTAVFGGENADGLPPLSKERVVSSLLKCGDTPFEIINADASIGDGAAIRISDVNALRREALEKLEDALAHVDAPVRTGETPHLTERRSAPIKTAYFTYADRLTPTALEYFDAVFLPLSEYEKLGSADKKIGIALPPVSFDGEREEIISRVKKARERGCEKALATSLWQFEILDGFEIFGDMRLNANNAQSADAIASLGASRVIASPEIGLARAASFKTATSAVAYGRLPLMTMQKCVIRDVVGIKSGDCSYCDAHAFTVLTDRTGAEFPVCREEGHRNVIYNSVPVWMCDKADEYERSSLGAHFVFTDESAAKVDRIIKTAKEKKPFAGKFKRI
ncbi:MAG: DUF3656 domain-containing protein, partial [Clostridia bacterium]|nr:DUF3656 domain-containing protein [Clostridia bacterium]